SFINYPFYLDKNTSRNNIVCYYFVAYYPSDSLTKSYSDTQCIRIGDYCLPQSRLYGLYAQSGNNNVINNPEPSLCLPGISIQTYSSRDVLNYNCDWYWNDSVLLNETETYHNLNDSSKKGFYRVIFNSGSVCPDTSNKVYVNVDGDGYNKITFEVLQKNLHKYANSTLNYICSSDTIFLKVKSKYPIYDSATISSNSNNHYVTKSFVKDSSYYKIYLLDVNINPDNFYVGSLKIFDKYHPTCSIQTPFLFLPFINSNININFKNNDSIILGDFNTDLILTTTIADPLWQFRKHTSSPWINIPNNLYTNNNNIPTLNFLNYRRSGYYRVIDTICNSISREAVGLFSNSNEVIEGQLFDSTNILMPNTPYTFNMYSDLSHLNLIKTINGITDANGRFILDSLPYNPNVRNLGYYWTITFIKDGLTKSFSDTVINNFKIHVSWYDLAVYQLRLVFKLSNPVGIKENKVLENLSIYPNPTKNNINIKFNNKFPTQLSITILNNLGQVVLNPENNRHIQN
ncbi:MAG TPA: hypothetical protein PLD02_17010, partial [Saprospiraceae bacterium]|nr:hypothetical protein [Saprospiraceae bacterium]